MNQIFWVKRLTDLEAEAHVIFGRLESAKSRTKTLDQSYQALSGLSLHHDDVFRQALRCVENELFRAAHVMAWAGFVDCLHTLVSSDSFAKLNTARQSWAISSIDQLAENYTEHALIEALQVANVVGKPEKKALHGMLSKRNECAHAGTYFPGFNETLGYISEIFSRLYRLLTKYPNLRLT